jgi:hypothetical protein
MAAIGGLGAFFFFFFLNSQYRSFTHPALQVVGGYLCSGKINLVRVKKRSIPTNFQGLKKTEEKISFSSSLLILFILLSPPYVLHIQSRQRWSI